MHANTRFLTLIFVYVFQIFVGYCSDLQLRVFDTRLEELSAREVLSSVLWSVHRPSVMRIGLRNDVECLLLVLRTATTRMSY